MAIWSSKTTAQGWRKWVYNALTNADFFQFNLDYANGQAEGRLQWNSEDGTLEVGMPGGVVNLQIGQENLVRVRNTTGSTITNGSAVYITGSQEGRPLVTLAKADGSPQAFVAGLATEDIVNNSNGYINTFGFVRDIDTSGLTEGALFYLSDTVAGGLTSTRPTAEDSYSVFLGVVITTHATEGVVIHTRVVVPKTFTNNIKVTNVSFPATQVPSADPNTQDDYEEGTWTPVLIGLTAAGVGTYTTQVGKYTKDGDVIHIDMTLAWTNHTGTGAFQLQGLPFTAGKKATLTIRPQNVTLPANNILCTEIFNTSTNIDLRGMPIGGGGVTLIGVDTTGEFLTAGTYSV